MKKYASVFVGVILFALPFAAHASTKLFIKQDVTAIRTGGLINTDFGPMKISYDGRTDWISVHMVGSGGPIDVLFDDASSFPVSYSVRVGTDPRGIFRPTLGTDCDGVMQKDESKTCEIQWLDTGINATIPAQQTQSATPPLTYQSVQNPIVTQSTVSIPVTQTEAQQIAALKAQIQELYKILLALLQQKLTKSVTR